MLPAALLLPVREDAPRLLLDAAADEDPPALLLAPLLLLTREEEGAALLTPPPDDEDALTPPLPPPLLEELEPSDVVVHPAAAQHTTRTTTGLELCMGDHPLTQDIPRNHRRRGCTTLRPMGRSPPTLQGRSRRVVTPPAAFQDELSPAGGTAPSRPRALRIVRAHGKPVMVPLKEEDRYVLGRHDAADVVFESASVSRLHGVLRADGDRWVYEDLGSSNGTGLLHQGEPRDVPPHVATEVFGGDVLHVGSADDRVELLAEAPALDVATPQGDATAVSPSARAFLARIELAARTRVPVFLLGPSGCGKTHTARQIHLQGLATGPFVPINCARLPQDSNALHSELLGHVRGAFTGAESARVGKLMHANGGTLFLDEVESLSSLAQGFLLDVLEGTGDLAPLGSRELATRAPVFRLISAAKAPLAQSGLRQDLCERLAEGHMWRLPVLDDRKEDIPGLLRFFASEQGKLLGVPVDVTPEAVALAVAAPWPGQIRQLRAMVVALAQTALAGMTGGSNDHRRITLRRADLEQHLRERDEAFGVRSLPPNTSVTLPPAMEAASDGGLKVKADARALTRDQVALALRQAGGSQAGAARALGIARNTLARRLKDFGLDQD